MDGVYYLIINIILTKYQKGEILMSELRVTIEGKNLDRIVNLSEAKKQREKYVTINRKTYILYDVNLCNNIFFFITGRSDECYN